MCFAKLLQDVLPVHPSKCYFYEIRNTSHSFQTRISIYTLVPAAFNFFIFIRLQSSVFSLSQISRFLHWYYSPAIVFLQTCFMCTLNRFYEILCKLVWTQFVLCLLSCSKLNNASDRTFESRSAHQISLKAAIGKFYAFHLRLSNASSLLTKAPLCSDK